ncbi:23S rRNA (adenine2503-C2)-methyltransferase [Lachnospiraceae bacterium NE2001]|nr:23S rRNA (adenine2503-C2)-methyltransferase [Lachnospiraceae bacterium NE2001]
MDINSLYIDELNEYVKEKGWPKFRAKQVFEWLHKKHVTSVDEMTNIPKAIRDELDQDITHVKYVTHQTDSEDGTRKFLFEMEDGQMIETVFMQYHHGNSICISSQAGCAMGCKFCASTIGGCIRNLTASEMLGQIYMTMNKVTEEKLVEDKLAGIEADSKAAYEKRRAEIEAQSRVSNIVVMGTGEPLQNYDNLIRFIKLIISEEGYNVSVRNITVSSCGIVPNIRRLADEGLGITFALSLHAPTDELRKTIMPVANKYTIEETLDATDYYFQKTGRRITIEYSLMNDVNDGVEQAEQLARLLRPRNRSSVAGEHTGIYHVNLIPINPVDERDYRPGTQSQIENFRKILENNHINNTVRRGLGKNIDAACGQLRRKYGI